MLSSCRCPEAIAKANALVRDAMRAGLALSVFDGEETTVTRERNDATKIIDALCTTESDVIAAHTHEGVDVGWILFIWENDADVIADWYVAEPTTHAGRTFNALVESLA